MSIVNQGNSAIDWLDKLAVNFEEIAARTNISDIYVSSIGSPESAFTAPPSLFGRIRNWISRVFCSKLVTIPISPNTNITVTVHDRSSNIDAIGRLFVLALQEVHEDADTIDDAKMKRVFRFVLQSDQLQEKSHRQACRTLLKQNLSQASSLDELTKIFDAIEPEQRGDFIDIFSLQARECISQKWREECLEYKKHVCASKSLDMLLKNISMLSQESDETKLDVATLCSTYQLDAAERMFQEALELPLLEISQGIERRIQELVDPVFKTDSKDKLVQTIQSLKILRGYLRGLFGKHSSIAEVVSGYIGSLKTKSNKIGAPSNSSSHTILSNNTINITIGGLPLSALSSVALPAVASLGMAVATPLALSLLGYTPMGSLMVFGLQQAGTIVLQPVTSYVDKQCDKLPWGVKTPAKVVWRVASTVSIAKGAGVLYSWWSAPKAQALPEQPVSSDSEAHSFAQVNGNDPSMIYGPHPREEVVSAKLPQVSEKVVEVAQNGSVQPLRAAENRLSFGEKVLEREASYYEVHEERLYHGGWGALTIAKGALKYLSSGVGLSSSEDVSVPILQTVKSPMGGTA